MDTDDSSSSSDSETQAVGRDSPISRSPSSASNRSSSPEAPKSPDSPQGPQRSPTSSPEGPKSPVGDGDVKSPASSHSSKASEASSVKKIENDGNTSDSSEASVDSSSRKNKTIGKNVDTLPEEISDGDMESDQEKEQLINSHKVNKDANEKLTKKEVNISHEDLSDVSDLDESIGGNSDVETNKAMENNGNIDENLTKTNETNNKEVIDKPRQEDGEEQLDFEAEDGECEELPQEQKKDNSSGIEEGETVDHDTLKEKEREELEEGEVSDEDDARPEETEPRPVCRFFSRGQCTWGASCRFLHPGVTDKGNYTMFELIRPVVPGEYGREERPSNYGRPEPAAQIESAWERGLRTAKEMLRKSIKRKEQDIDFEEKKMNLTLAQEELEKENGYYGRIATSPEPRYVRHVPIEYPPPATAIVRASHLPSVAPQSDEYYPNRRQVIYEPDYMPPPTTRERVRPSYRELPSHRMPDYYNNKYEDELAVAPVSQLTKVRTKPKREVIVQRLEERPVRGDEWSDPWMRSKSPAGRKSGGSTGATTVTSGGGGSGRKRSYSSGSSYSSSSSSRSSSESSKSSFRSRSRSHTKVHTSSKRRTRHNISPSVIVSERKAANERAALMNPPAPKKRAPSPSMMRVSASNPPAPVMSSSSSMQVSTVKDQFGRTRSKLAVAAALARVKGRNNRHSSKSSSDSSGSSSSDSDSSASSSSTSRDGSTPRRNAGAEIVAKAMDVLKGGTATTEKRQQIKLNLKNPMRKPDLSDLAQKSELMQGKKRQATSPLTVPVVANVGASTTATDAKSKKATSRREELLKQLKAVEDAIAKKRSKV